MRNIFLDSGAEKKESNPTDKPLRQTEDLILGLCSRRKQYEERYGE